MLVRWRLVSRDCVAAEQLSVITVTTIEVLEALFTVLEILFILRIGPRNASGNRIDTVAKKIEGGEGRRFESVLHDPFRIVRSR